jgi:hypothetical protein
MFKKNKIKDEISQYHYGLTKITLLLVFLTFGVIIFLYLFKWESIVQFFIYFEASNLFLELITESFEKLILERIGLIIGLIIGLLSLFEFIRQKKAYVFTDSDKSKHFDLSYSMYSLFNYIIISSLIIYLFFHKYLRTKEEVFIFIFIFIIVRLITWFNGLFNGLLKQILKIINNVKVKFLRYIYKIFLLPYASLVGIIEIFNLSSRILFYIVLLIYLLISGIYEIAFIILLYFLTIAVVVPLLKNYTKILHDYDLLDKIEPGYSMEKVKNEFFNINYLDKYCIKNYLKKNISQIQVLSIWFIYKNINLFQKSIIIITFIIPLGLLSLNFNLFSTIYFVLTAIYWYLGLSIISNGFPSIKVDIFFDKKSKTMNSVYIIEDNKDYIIICDKDKNIIKINKSFIHEIRKASY